MGATPLYLAIILARANAYSRTSATLRLSGTIYVNYFSMGSALARKKRPFGVEYDCDFSSVFCVKVTVKYICLFVTESFEITERPCLQFYE